MNYTLSPEEQECIPLVQYLELLKSSKKVLLYSHVASETYTTSWRQKYKNKINGVRSGIPDYLVIFPKTILFLEMKRVKGGVVSPSQKEWIAALQNREGVVAVVAKGFNQAKEVIDIIVEREKT